MFQYQTFRCSTQRRPLYFQDFLENIQMTSGIPRPTLLWKGYGYRMLLGKISCRQVSYWAYRRPLSNTFASSTLLLMWFQEGLVGTAQKQQGLPPLFYLNHALSFKIISSHQVEHEWSRELCQFPFYVSGLFQTLNSVVLLAYLILNKLRCRKPVTSLSGALSQSIISQCSILRFSQQWFTRCPSHMQSSPRQLMDSLSPPSQMESLPSFDTSLVCDPLLEKFSLSSLPSKWC